MFQNVLCVQGGTGCLLSTGVTAFTDEWSLSAAQYKTVSPVGDRVFVKVDASDPVSVGGILLPTSAQKKPTQGEVVALGNAKSLKVSMLPAGLNAIAQACQVSPAR